MQLSISPPQSYYYRRMLLTLVILYDHIRLLMSPRSPAFLCSSKKKTAGNELQLLAEENYGFDPLSLLIGETVREVAYGSKLTHCPPISSLTDSHTTPPLFVWVCWSSALNLYSLPKHNITHQDTKCEWALLKRNLWDKVNTVRILTPTHCLILTPAAHHLNYCLMYWALPNCLTYCPLPDLLIFDADTWSRCLTY